MGRPHKYPGKSSVSPPFDYFIPYGSTENNRGKIFLTEEELEALKIYHYDNIKSQIVAAQQMNLSQATFSRLLTKAYEKMTKALIEGLAIGLISHRGHWGWQHGSPHQTSFSSPVVKQANATPDISFNGYGCLDCGFEWKIEDPNQKSSQKLPCPQCKSKNTYYLMKRT